MYCTGIDFYLFPGISFFLKGRKILLHGDLIFDEIDYRGIKQKNLAEAMGIAPTVLIEIIHGKRKPACRTCHKTGRSP